MRIFKGKYKYILDEIEVFETGIRIPMRIDHEMFTMTLGGRLTINRLYAYDGPSGPTIDTKLFIWISLPHDVGYQMIRAGMLPEHYRPKFDKLLYDMALEGKPATETTKRIKPMWKIRAKWIYRAVRVGGYTAATPANRKKPMVF